MKPLLPTNEQATLTFLRSVLEGVKVTEQRLTALLSDKVLWNGQQRTIQESQYLEFKCALWLRPEAGARTKVGKPLKLGAKIRKYIAGFANSEGGVLVVGVAEPTEERTDFRLDPISPDDQRLVEVGTIKDMLKDLGPNLQPMPEVQIVPVEGGLALVIAVDRGYHLLACLEQGEHVHYWRMFDSTRHAPQFLVQDMVLGRRRRPVVDVEFSFNQDYRSGATETRLRPTLTVRNQSMAWIDDIRAGVIWYGPGDQEIPAELRTRIQNLPCQADNGYIDDFSGTTRQLPQNQMRFLMLQPETQAPVPAFGTTRLADANHALRVVWNGVNHVTLVLDFALFVSCRGHPPEWFSLRQNLSIQGLNDRRLQNSREQGYCRQTNNRIDVARTLKVGG